MVSYYTDQFNSQVLHASRKETFISPLLDDVNPVTETLVSPEHAY
jgi:hypothetical protein